MVFARYNVTAAIKLDKETVASVAVDEGAVGGIHSNEENGNENENFQCEPCLIENADVQATAFCMDCFERLCTNCTRDHRKNKISRSHKLLDGDEIPKDLKAVKVLKQMMACSDHPRMDVTYKCKDHDKYICVTCLAECHQKCNEVNEIPLIASSTNEDLCNSVKESISHLQEYTSTSKSASKDNLDSLRSQHSAIQKEQQTLFDNIYEELDQRKKQLELETDEVIMKELNEIGENLQQYNEAEKEEQEYQRLLDITGKYGNARDLNVIPDLISRKVKFLKESLEAKCKTEQTFVKFDCSMDLKALTNLGKVSVICSEQVKQPDPSGEHRLSSDEVLETEKESNDMTEIKADNTSLQSMVTKNIDEVPPQLGQLSLATEQSALCSPTTKQKSQHPSFMKRSVGNHFISYNVRCQDDKFPCAIYAIVILPDDRLVLIDYSNMKLKVLEKDFSLAFTFNFHDKPLDMCHAYDNTVAVYLLDGRTVKKYGIGRSHVSFTGEFPTRFLVEALAKFGNDNKVAILFSDERGTRNERYIVQIRHAVNGRILETLYLEKSPGVTLKLDEDGGKRLFCRKTNEIFVSERWKLHCFGIDNNACFCAKQSDSNFIQESWFYKGRKGSFLKDVSDIAADEEGNTYVCDLNSNNIHQLSSDNYRENRIILKNINEPMSISVNSKQGCLVVGCRNDDYIRVYHFG